MNIDDVNNIDKFLSDVNNGDMDAVRRAIANGMPVDIKPKSDDETALDMASIGGNYDMAKYLLSIGANPNHTNSKGNHSLIHAACYGHKSIVMLLLQHNANKAISGDKGTAEDWVNKNGHPDIAALINNCTSKKWQRTEDTQIEHHYTEANNTRQITDVFNFAAQERTRYATILGTSQLGVAVTAFKDIHPPILQEAFNELVSAGGTSDIHTLPYRTLRYISRRKT